LLDVDQLPQTRCAYGLHGRLMAPSNRQRGVVERMPKRLAILACAGILMTGVPALGAPSCRYVSSWHLSRDRDRADLVAGGAASDDYVVAAEKGTVVVVFKEGAHGESEQRRALAAPNSLMLNRPREIWVERDGRRPAHGTLQVCRW
jgi:hypothetical protein